MSRQVKIAAVLVSIAAALVIGYLAYQHSQAHSREALLNKSAEMAQTGYYADAARLIDRALTLPGDGVRSDEMLYLKKADYLQKSGDTAEALSIAMRVVKNTQEGQQEFDDAWERIVSICSEEGEYGKLATLLEGSELESVKSKYGTYKGEMNLIIESQGVGTVFYTIDGEEPTDRSNLYTDGIRLRPGIYTVKALFINRYGLKSSIITGTYQILDD